jgi:ABC-type bacteriocin/lantibiotic exporter with double-glycine peptidase domain
MILSFWGKELPEQDVRILLKTKISGTSPIHVSRLESLGFRGTFLFSSIDELKEYVSRGIPCIVHLWTGYLSYWASEYMHAAVVIRVEDETIDIHDPAFDDFPKHLPIDEFSRAWFSSSQLLIVIEPISDSSPHDEIDK